MFKASFRTRLPASLLLALAPALAACGSGDDTIVKLPADAGSDATTVDSGSDAASTQPDAASTEPDAGTEAAATGDDGGDGAAPPTGLGKLNHFVIFYMENHSFDNLYGEFPGAEGLSAVQAGASNVIQLGGDGGPYGTLPFPPSATVFADASVPNGPFPTQEFYAVDQDTIDLHHIFFTEQFQINDGGMNKFTYFSDALGFSMGHWHTMSFPVPTLAQQFTVCDHFFHAAFGGSFLNHFWLISARTPEWPGAAAADAGGPSVDDPAVVMANPG
ncbi:MAG TPA: alkaline phosphatase family protein, partial [Polyangiaceae bacterium]